MFNPKTLFARLRLLLLMPLLAFTAVVAQAENLTEDDVNQMVRDYILENPEIVMEAIGILQEREQAAQVASQNELLASVGTQLTNGANDPVGGNPDGTVTLVEFFDYNCGYCKRASDTVKALTEANPNLRIVYKEWPILSETSVTAARFGLAINELHPDQYQAYHDALLARPGSLGQDSEIWQVIDSLGLDRAELEEETKADWVQQTLASNQALAQQLNITGTPTFVIGTDILRGAYPQADIQAAIDANLP
ncbi:DsbA family protein [Saccharospirillum impatiens]|uniref:DsbA family protein n=1 Tax=Saccharospirillum impatiens TaxID=169438 RepID=UPI0003FAD045|nr:DsbA family protein [Saccharospirillum impatiens]